MINEDLVAASIRHPMDWGKVEALVLDLLQADDMPAIRRLGGTKDKGLDGKQESFFLNEYKIATAVQVTSQRAQKRKTRTTIEKLKKNGVSFERLVMVFRDPVATSVETEMRSAAAASGIVIEVRDESYLCGQLARPETGVFNKHFGDKEAFLDRLLRAESPLSLSDSAIETGILASACAFSVLPSKRIRLPALDHICLACIARSNEGTLSTSQLYAEAKKIVPDLHEETLSVALERLAARGACQRRGGVVSVPAAQRAKLANGVATIVHYLDTALGPVLDAATEITSFDEAALGRAERNVRRTIAELIRSTGPIPGTDASVELRHRFDRVSDQCSSLLGDGLTLNQTHSLGAALETYLRQPEYTPFLASLVRAYAVLAACNVDPLGARYSRKSFTGRSIYLDTGTVLNLLLPDLPESAGVRSGIDALKECGAKLFVTESVLREVAIHFEISPKTHRALPGLKNYPASVVETKANNALVRAYYYNDDFGEGLSEFKQFRKNHYDHDAPIPFLREQLVHEHLGVDFSFAGTKEDLVDEERLVADRIAETLRIRKERSRRKASYRDPFEMESRALTDAVQALLASRLERTASGRLVSGYVSSDDSAFAYITQLDDWEKRPHVQLRRSFLPTLAEMLGVQVSDADLARLVWNPIALSAGTHLSEDIDIVARHGVSLRRTSIVRLEKELQSGLHDKLDLYRSASRKEGSVQERIGLIYALHQELSRHGYAPDRQLHEIVRALSEVEIREKENRENTERLRELTQRLLDASKSTKRGRRRIRRVIQDLGLRDLIGELSDEE